MNYIFQIFLKSVYLLENGEKILPKGSNVLSIALIYPREGQKLIETIKSLPLGQKEKERKAPLKVKKEYSLEFESFENKLFLKESIQGDSILKISLGIALSPNKVDEIVKKLLKAGVISAVGAFTGGAGVTISTSIAKAAVETFFESNKDKNQVVHLGTASLGINNSTQEGEMVFSLLTNKAIKYTVDKKIQDDQILETVRTIPKGYAIAKIVLVIEKKPKEGFSSVIA